MTDRPATGAGESTGAPTASEEDGPTASGAFEALGSETRTGAVQALADEGDLAFSELFAATAADTSAGFAYHLRQLVGRFVRKRADERYELTAAGRAAARALRAGTYTASVDRDPIDVDGDCPCCARPALVATVADNVTRVACEACETPLAALTAPPGAYADRADDAIPDAVEAHQRGRVDSFADGVCPDCAGPVATRVEPVDWDESDADDRSGFRAAADRDGPAGTGSGDSPARQAASGGTNGADHERVQAVFACETCGATLRCPVTLAVLDEPAVVAFYHDHGRSLTDRPVWNVGREWRERLVSRDPWCVEVSTRLGDECLFCYVARDGRLVATRRGPAPDESAGVGDGRSDDDPDGGSRPTVDRPETGVDHEESRPDESRELDHGSAADGATA
jgi:hypothetical protein